MFSAIAVVEMHANNDPTTRANGVRRTRTVGAKDELDMADPKQINQRLDCANLARQDFVNLRFTLTAVMPRIRRIVKLHHVYFVKAISN